MGDDAFKKLARVEAVSAASREEALSHALRRQRVAEEQARFARAKHGEAEAVAERTKDDLLSAGSISAEELARRADDFVRSRTRLEDTKLTVEEAEGAQSKADTAARNSRREWAQAQARKKALEKKLSDARKHERDRRDNREED